ncbi:DUF3592 domain-containing protein [Streptomyces tropicalis]|uniref:DUF3592 domain-containing protein n=1 Tax=Streptomyces tropicalis TaxID=3034234 RepID=A0ABT6A784_9ACTN|nr:DUF3592 domain-containing protein [Streptomyces tropicalis]MDF3300512.1 hypothetical protein [Streptomyces tropicalis]
MQKNTRTRRWGRVLAAAVTALIGAVVLTANVVHVVRAEGRISALRAHGRRVPGDAEIVRHCSGGRFTECSTTSVWLDFRDGRGIPVTAVEPRLATSLYVPAGPADADGRVRTTVVYDPAAPEEAQAAGALDWGPLDLAGHRWFAFAVGLVLAGAGAVALLSENGSGGR